MRRGAHRNSPAALRALIEKSRGAGGTLRLSRDERVRVTKLFRQACAPCATLAFARSRHGNHFNRTAMDAAQDLSKLVANLPDEPLAAFEAVVRAARETRRLTAEMEPARAALKAAGDDEAHSG